MNLLKRLWRDEVGLVVSAETMMVGTLGVIGAVAGIATATSSVNDEMSQLGQAFRGFNQSYSVTGTSISMGRGGMAAGGASSGFAVTTGASGFQQVAPSVDIQAARTQYLQTVAATTQALEIQNDVCGQTSVQPQHLGTIGQVVVEPRSQTIPAGQY